MMGCIIEYRGIEMSRVPPRRDILRFRDAANASHKRVLQGNMQYRPRILTVALNFVSKYLYRRRTVSEMDIGTRVSLNSRPKPRLLLEISARRHFRPSVNSRDDTVAENTPRPMYPHEQPSMYPSRTHTRICMHTCTHMYERSPRDERSLMRTPGPSRRVQGWNRLPPLIEERGALLY